MAFENHFQKNKKKLYCKLPMQLLKKMKCACIQHGSISMIYSGIWKVMSWIVSIEHSHFIFKNPMFKYLKGKQTLEESTSNWGRDHPWTMRFDWTQQVSKDKFLHFIFTSQMSSMSIYFFCNGEHFFLEFPVDMWLKTLRYKNLLGIQ